MKNQENEKDSRLVYWQALYESALLAASDTLESLERNMAQYLGSDEIDGSTENGTGREMIAELNKVCDKLKVAGTFAPHTEI